MKEYVPFNVNYLIRFSKLKNISSDIAKNIQTDITLDEVLNRQMNESSLKRSEKENNPEKEDFLETIINERRRFLVGAIKQLGFFHQERKRISDELKYKIDYATTYYKNLLYELDFWPRGYNSMVENRRIHLEKIHNNLEQEKRQEETSCWRDILNVSRDMRSLLREYMELMIRRRIVQNK